MLIDWFTVGAQLVNFLVLVWLLKRFLYKPILKAIDSREKRIAAELADADAKKAEAQKERDDFEAKNKAFDEQRGILLAKAADEAQSEHERLLGLARKEVDQWCAKQHASLRMEQTRLSDEITRLATGEIFQIARKALADLATVSLEERIGEVFTRRLRELEPKTKDSLAVALRTSTEHAVVSSVFDLGALQRAAIQNALNEEFSADVHVRFETSPDGICGIELTVGGQKVGWSISTYLSSLEQKVNDVVEAQSIPAAGLAPQTFPTDVPALKSVA